MPEFDVVGIGSTVYDTLMVVDRFPQEDTKQRGIETRIQGGGPCATALVAASKLGLSAAYMGTIGGDSFGRYMLEDFARFGVDTSHVRVEEDAVSFHSTVLLNRQSGGGIILDAQGLRGYDCYRVEVADSNGCGDTFHGAFVAGMLKGMGVDSACRYASAAAAIKCMRLGARRAMPDDAECRAFLAARGVAL